MERLVRLANSYHLLSQKLIPLEAHSQAYRNEKKWMFWFATSCSRRRHLFSL